jgi:hypothetical protein
MMQYPLNIDDRMFIVDNFYTNPDAIREFAIQQEKENESGGNYAGVMTHAPFITPEHLETISHLVGHPVESGTQLSGKFRFTKENDTYSQDIHFDPGDRLVWAGVWYGTPGIETDGTIMWKHKRTGLESIPLTQQGIEKHGWYGVDDLKKFLETDGIDHSKWEKTLTLPFRYNRLVLFRPWMFHSPGKAFGDTLENCRLIQTFFFRTK